jgi:dihydroorotate dehydrogenase (fumarate)
MEEKGYSSINDFRGKLSKLNLQDPYAFEREQYLDLLLKGKII